MNFSEIKNYAMKRGVEQLLKEYVTRMVNLSINPATKTVQFSVELKGEDKPIEVTINNYEFDERDGTLFLIIHDLSVSKEWMHVLAQQVVAGRPIEMGAGSTKILDVIRMLHVL